MKNPAFTGLIERFILWIIKDPWVKVGYGYPAKSHTWLTVYHRRKADKWVYEWDDLFADSRPKRYTWGHNYFFFTDGATDQEESDVRYSLIMKGKA